MYLPPDTHLLYDFYVSYVSYWLFSSTGLGGAGGAHGFPEISHRNSNADRKSETH